MSRLENKVAYQQAFQGGTRNKEECYLSKRRRVESKQLAKTQLPSFDNEIQLTACPKLSTISLVYEMKSVLEQKSKINPNKRTKMNFTTKCCLIHVRMKYREETYAHSPSITNIKCADSSINTTSNDFSFCQTDRHYTVLKCINDLGRQKEDSS